jgi:hypothetical protein
MGGHVLERMIQLTQRSPRFREIMRDLFSGAQEYSDLRQRVYEKLPRIAMDVVASTLWTTLGKRGTTREGSLGSLKA